MESTHSYEERIATTTAKMKKNHDFDSRLFFFFSNLNSETLEGSQLFPHSYLPICFLLLLLF